MTQKDLDLEVADRLDDFASKLSPIYLSEENFSEHVVLYYVGNETECFNIISALRYAIASLRTEDKNG